MTAKTKSPFYIVQEFISPLMCEEIIDQMGFIVPDQDKDGKPIPSIKTDADYEAYLYGEFQRYASSIAAYFDKDHRATTEFTFEWYPTGSKGKMKAENAIRAQDKWMRVYDRDITCVLFLSDYQSVAPIDEDYEVYGGKLEFPQHGFGFNAQRGTLIAFPSVPNFINGIAPILAGNLYLAKFHIATSTPLFYNPALFPGNYKGWFTDFI